MNFRKKTVIAVTVIAGMFLVDRLTKFLVVSESFGVRYTLNTGIAFGIPVIQSFILVTTLLLMIVLVSYMTKAYKEKDIKQIYIFGFIFSGAISNALDRYLYSGVVDFIKMGSWPLFNIADISITLGIVLLVLSLFSHKDEEVSKA